MAVSLVGSPVITNFNTKTASAITASITGATLGDTLILAVLYIGASSGGALGPSTVTTTSGTTSSWTRLNFQQGGSGTTGNGVEWWYATTSGSGTQNVTVSMTPLQSVIAGLWLAEIDNAGVAGVAPGTPVSGMTNTATSANLQYTTMTVSSAGSLVLVGGANEFSLTDSTGLGTFSHLTFVGTEYAATTYGNYSVNTPGSTTTGWTSTSSAWSTAGIVIPTAASAPSSVSPWLLGYVQL